MTKKKLVIFDLDNTLVEYICGFPVVLPETRYILDTVKAAGYKMALATYNKKPMWVLEKCGLEDIFDYVGVEFITEPLLVDYKRDLLRRVMEHFEVSADQVVFYDDQRCNIDVAKALGIKDSILVSYTSGITQQNVDFLLQEDKK